MLPSEKKMPLKRGEGIIKNTQVLHFQEFYANARSFQGSKNIKIKIPKIFPGFLGVDSKSKTDIYGG